jgi:hypothetical protein
VLVELVFEVLPPCWFNGESKMMQPPEHLSVRPEIEAGHVEKRQRVAIADIEEEVCRAPVVTIFEHLGEGELEQALVKLHRPLDITAQKGDMVHTPR